MDLYTDFPKITYNGKNARNIMVNIDLVRGIIDKYKVFYDYVIKEGERPDTIAFDYYGDSDLEWLVCLPNNIIDIHSEWPLSQKRFYDYIVNTYGSISYAQTTVKHYKYTGIGGDTQQEIARISWFISPTTYSNMSAEEKSGWTPVYFYDYENELNEAKRIIKLLSNEYTNQVKKELRELLL